MVKLTEVEDEHFREEQQGPPPTKGDHTLAGADDEEDDDFTDTGMSCPSHYPLTPSYLIFPLLHRSTTSPLPTL